ncbi:MAG: aspartate dehydrogenase domain-containing protein [Pseudorhodoplanes sp.]
MKRIGIVGFGFIGAALYRAIEMREIGDLETAFVFNRSAAKLENVPSELILHDLSRAADYRPDLIVECSHPDVSIDFGTAFLSYCDYMPLSVTALADDTLREALIAAARASGHRLMLPRGALVGMDGLFSWRHMWRDVTITFRKHPKNLDLSRTGRSAESIVEELVLYDGPVRGIAKDYPRNVNTMVTCALATIGLDRCRARLVADPRLDHAVAEVEAVGSDGSYLQTVKRQPAIGVSGTEMFQSTLRSVQKATGNLQALDFV